jgi:hypothetical protein
MKLYRRQIEGFRRDFGGPRGPKDNASFDAPERTPPCYLSDDAQRAVDRMVSIMGEAGVDAKLIYAYRTTGGLFPSDDGPLTIEDQREWDSAVRGYRGNLLGTAIQ